MLGAGRVRRTMFLVDSSIVITDRRRRRENGAVAVPWSFSSRGRGPGSVSFFLLAATSASRVPKHEWNASFAGRCTRETTTGPEWNGPGGSAAGPGVGPALAGPFTGHGVTSGP